MDDGGKLLASQHVDGKVYPADSPVPVGGNQVKLGCCCFFLWFWNMCIWYVSVFHSLDMYCISNSKF